jgi:hypothetical protein
MKLERTIDEAAHSALPPALREAYAKGPDGKYALQLHEDPAPQRPQNGGAETVDLSDEKVRARLRRMGEPAWQDIGEHDGATISLGFRRTTAEGNGVWLARWKRDGQSNVSPLGDVLTEQLKSADGPLSNLRRARSLDHSAARTGAMTWAKEALGKLFPR